MTGFLTPLLGTGFLTMVASISLWYATTSLVELGATPANTPGATPSETPQGAASGEQSTANPIALPVARAAKYYDVVMQRPLFFPNRRPRDPRGETPVAPEPTLAPAPEPEKSAPSFVLHGVMQGTGKKRAALLSTDGTDLQVFHVSDKIKGWRLSEIMADRVTLTRGSDVIQLELYK